MAAAPTNSYAPTHGQKVVGEAPPSFSNEFAIVLNRTAPLQHEYAPVAPASAGSSMAVPNVAPYAYSVRGDEMLPSGDAAAFGSKFDGAGPHQLTFTSTKEMLGVTTYEFAKDGQPLLTGVNTLVTKCSNLCQSLECLGWLEPFHRNWTMSTMSKETVFSFEIMPGWLDSQIHMVKNQEGIEVGRIQQPSFVQRMSDMWRQQLQVVVRIIDSKGYERFTLRRAGGCGQSACPMFAKLAPKPSDACYGRWNTNLAAYIDCDCSNQDCGTCNDKCNIALDQPCCKCSSCRQCCEYRECDVCFARPDLPCCECECYHCDICGAEQCKCCADPLCQPCCHPGNGVCDQQCADCGCVCKEKCDMCAVCMACNCFKGCDFKLCVFNCHLCKCTDCTANWGKCIKLQCCEIKRALCECPDCVTKIKNCCSKIIPQCKRECTACINALKLIPQCIKLCITKCPHRCRQMFCGGREVRIELDVYGPDGDDGVAVCKILFQGTSGWSCGCSTLRAKYTCTINIPSVSPYYVRWRNESRGCDYVDLALLTSLAIWYDFFTVAPREWFQCADPIVREGAEKWPANAYYEYQINPPVLGSPNFREPDTVMMFKWLYGDDFAYLIDPSLYRNRFNFQQAQPAGTMPIKEPNYASAENATLKATPVMPTGSA